MSAVATSKLWIGIALVALGCGTSSPPGGGGGGQAGGGQGGQGGSGGAVALHGIAVTLSDFMVMPDALSAKAGVVAFAVQNASETPHDFSIRDGDGSVLAQTPQLPPGGSFELETTLSAGEYVTFCSLAGHESLGMKGTLTVMP